jgi:hypothetical protein
MYHFVVHVGHFLSEVYGASTMLIYVHGQYVKATNGPPLNDPVGVSGNRCGEGRKCTVYHTGEKSWKRGEGKRKKWKRKRKRNLKRKCETNARRNCRPIWQVGSEFTLVSVSRKRISLRRVGTVPEALLKCNEGALLWLV